MIEAAALHSQRLQDAPGNVSVITREDIHRYGYRTLGEALSSATGFYISYDRIYHYVGIRGFSLPGDYNTRFLVMVNGHYLTDNVYSSNGFFGQDFGIDMDLVERIEIIRGPSSVLYGSNGMFATINVVTRSPSESASTVAIETRSFGEKKASASLSMDLSHGVKALISASVFNNAGQTVASPNGIAVDSDAEKGYHFFSNVTWKDWSFTAMSTWRGKLIPTGWYETLLDDRGTRIGDGRGFLEALYTHDVGANGDLHWRIYYDRYTYDGRYDSSLRAGQIQDNRDRTRGDWLGTQLAYRIQNAPQGALTLGGEMRWDLRGLQENFDVQPRTVQKSYSNVKDRYYGLFAQQEWNLNSRWQANLGVRLDGENQERVVFSPRASLTFQKSPRTTFKFLYGRAFRNPNQYEEYYADGTFNLPNPSLRVESVDTIEVNAEHRFGSRFSIAVNPYYSRVGNLITLVALGPESWQFQNVSSSNAVGLELEGKAHLFRESEIFTGWSVQHVDSPSLSQQANSPTSVGKARFYTPMVRHRLGLALAYGYMSSRKTASGARLDPVHLADLTLSSIRLSGGLEVEAGVRNLFNRKYYDPVSLDHGVDRLEQNGISYFLRISWRSHEGGSPPGATSDSRREGPPTKQ